MNSCHALVQYVIYTIALLYNIIVVIIDCQAIAFNNQIIIDEMSLLLYALILKLDEPWPISL